MVTLHMQYNQSWGGRREGGRGQEGDVFIHFPTRHHLFRSGFRAMLKLLSSSIKSLPVSASCTISTRFKIKDIVSKGGSPPTTSQYLSTCARGPRNPALRIPRQHLELPFSTRESSSVAFLLSFKLASTPRPLAGSALARRVYRPSDTVST